MDISPLRRSRILKAHELRQNGDSLPSIATALNISQATLLADLRLLETHWPEVADALADDLLLELLTLLQARLQRLTSAGPPLLLEHIAGGGDPGERGPRSSQSDRPPEMSPDWSPATTTRSPPRCTKSARPSAKSSAPPAGRSPAPTPAQTPATINSPTRHRP